METPDGVLWVGTYYGGLNRYDPVRGIFEQYLPDATVSDTYPVSALMICFWMRKDALGGDPERVDPAEP